MERVPRINILSEDVHRKIAAGEVVDRPSSVVKELIENSLDAQAKRIEVQIRSAGKELISVKDDGVGIHPEDLEKAVLPHATSKIAQAQDLLRISSFGFRGEALYSISSVSNMALRSRVEGQDLGWEIEVRAGKVVARRPVAMARGTEVSVRALFFNTPGRRKFLKSDRTENTHIIRTVLPYLLTYPEKEISLYIDDKLVLSPKGRTKEERISFLFGIEKGALISSQSKLIDKGVYVEAILGSPQLRRPRRDQQMLFVNQRPVYHQAILSAINRVYRSMMPPEFYPVFFLWIDLPPEMVDVNIHPQKREVKFQSEAEMVSQIARFVEARIRSVLAPKMVKPSYSIGGKGERFSVGRENKEITGVRERGAEYTTPAKESVSTGAEGEETYLWQGEERERLDLLLLLKRAREVGVVFRKYGLLEVEEGLLVIDLHAAQERINYEKLLRAYEEGSGEVQDLLSPEILPVSVEEMRIWEEIKEDLERMGFRTSLWQDGKIAVHSHPKLVSHPAEVVRELLASRELKVRDTVSVKEVLARKACRSSIMAGDNLGIEHIRQIRKDLLSCQHPLSCPHGRPTVVLLPERRLDELFLRGR